jgi:hypothetical protein
MKKLFFLLAFSCLFFAKISLAICPVCTIAVGAGVGLSRYLGIDDIIAGLWIGGLTVSVIMWTINWMERKNINFKFKKNIITFGYYLLIVAPLFWTGIMGHEFNKFWGIDKLLVGIIFGSVVFLASSLWYQKIKKENKGKAQFPFQKVVMPVGFLAFFSVIFYFLTK